MEPSVPRPDSDGLDPTRTLPARDGSTDPRPIPSVRERPTIPGYEILEELGFGGMGVVYKARQLSLQRIVAIKVIRGAGRDYEQRFQREAQAVALLNHPHLVKIHEFGTHDGQTFMALEYADAGTLSQFCREKPLEPRESAALVEALAHAVQHAHQNGILHRDLKPSNILLSSTKEKHPTSTLPGLRLSGLVPKIADFGLARHIEGASEGGTTPGERLTLSGALVGTPSYMAPEQACGKTELLGPATDVYALGVILYELLTGKPPFEAATPMETLMRVVSDEPTPPRRLNKNCPRDLETICLVCLAKEPERRYASAAELADDLRRFLDHIPIGRQPGLWKRRLLSRFRRHRSLVLAGMGGAVLAAVLLIGFFLLRNPRSDPTLTENHPALLKMPTDLALVPARLNGLLVVRIAELKDRPFGRELFSLRGMSEIGLSYPALKHLGLDLSRLERMSVGLVGDFDIDRVIRIYRPTRALDHSDVAARLKQQGFELANHRGVEYWAEKSWMAIHVAEDGMALVAGTKDAMREWINGRETTGDNSPGLKDALRQAQMGSELVFYVQPTPTMRFQLLEPWQRLCTSYNLRQVMPGQPRPPSPPYLKGLEELEEFRLAVNFKESTDQKGAVPLLVKTRLRFSGKEAAVNTLRELPELSTYLAHFWKDDPNEWAAPIPPSFTKAFTDGLRSIQAGEQEGVLDLEREIIGEPAWPLQLTEVAEESAFRRNSQENLRKLYRAMSDYIRANKDTFPPAIFKSGPAGKPLLSWRVALLPYLDQKELYDEFRHDEPWDSTHNEFLMGRIPEPFRTPSGQPFGSTYYQVFVGKETIFPGKEGVKIERLFNKGIANVLLIAEGAKPVPWTKPEDIPYDAAKPFPAWGGLQKHGGNVVFGDGTIRFLPRSLPEATLRAFITLDEK